MAHKETWYCHNCGSHAIHHDAVAKYDPATETFEVLDVLDDTWCQSCMEESGGEDKGKPAFGIAGVTNEVED